MLFIKTRKRLKVNRQKATLQAKNVDIKRIKMDKKYVNFNGCADDTVAFLTREALMDKAIWKKFVQVFREQQDGTNYGWRGEYWGKMMRGAAMVY
ncbi:MAG: hypothetical protein J6B71_00895, partial [Clostridia bacterium]|nr:hypothetical protein [Clostridia bacterium]